MAVVRIQFVSSHFVIHVHEEILKQINNKTKVVVFLGGFFVVFLLFFFFFFF